MTVIMDVVAHLKNHIVVMMLVMQNHTNLAVTVVAQQMIFTNVVMMFVVREVPSTDRAGTTAVLAVAPVLTEQCVALMTEDV